MNASVHIGLRVPPDLAAEFERVAAGDDRTVSSELRRLMRLRVEAERATPPIDDDGRGAAAERQSSPAYEEPDDAGR